MNPFKGRHFQRDIILWAVRWYCKYGISYPRNLNGQGSESDLAAELADVEIMTEQLRLQGMDRLIDFHKQKKLERLAARLGVIYTNE